MHGSLIVGMEHRISLLEDKMSDVDARARRPIATLTTEIWIVSFILVN